MAQCKDCKWKPGLDDEHNVCSSCKGTGEAEVKQVKAEPVKTEVKKGKK